MPSVNPRVETRLSIEEFDRFRRLALQRDVTQSQLARDAISFYLNWLDKGERDAQESLLERRLKKMEDRIAALLARANIDVGVIINILYSNMPKETREEAIQVAHKKSVLRLRNKTEKVEELKERYKQIIEAE